MLRRVLLCALATGLVVPAVAAGEVRYAMPDGAVRFDACPADEPCALAYAVEYAHPGDEVVLAPGTYDVIDTLDVTADGLTVHGPGPGRPATIVSSGPSRAFSVTGANITFRDLKISSTSITSSQPLLAAIGAGDVVERVVVTANGTNLWGVLLAGGSTMRDSVVRVAGMNAIAVTAGDGGGTVFGSTIVGQGSNNAGAFASSCFGATASLSVFGSIVRTTGRDVATAASCGGAPSIALGWSNFGTADSTLGGTIRVGSGNQRTGREPRFVNLATGDLRETASSPTIDAGRADARLGTLDLAGNPRVAGSAPDIGAYERQPAGGGAAPVPAPLPTAPGAPVPDGPGPVPGIDAPATSTSSTTTPTGAAAKLRVSAIRLDRSAVSLRLSGTASVRVTIDERRAGRWHAVTTVRAKRRGAGALRRSLIAHLRLHDGRYRLRISASGPSGTVRMTTVQRLG